jgi:hypothetical protein
MERKGTRFLEGGGLSENQNPPVIEGGENPPGGGEGGEESYADHKFYVTSGTDTGLTDGTAYETLAAAYEAALTNASHKRIVVLADVSAPGAEVLDPTGIILVGDDTILIEGGTPAVKIERNDGANDSVIEITGGAKIAFKNITINGKINPDANETDSNNRALKITGAGTKVTLEDGVVVTGKKIGSKKPDPTEDDGSGVLVSGGAELVMTGTAKVTDCVEEGPFAKGAVWLRRQHADDGRR